MKELISKELTEEEAFVVQQYVLDFNVRFTSQRTGLSERVVRRIIKKPEAQVSIDNLKAKIAEKCDLTAEQIMNELKRIALYDAKEHIESISDAGVVFKEMDDIDGRAMAEITTSTTSDGLTYTTMKTHSKMKALEILMNYFKGQEGDKHVHVHYDSESLKGKTANESANAYNNLLNS